MLPAGYLSHGSDWAFSPFAPTGVSCARHRCDKGVTQHFRTGEVEIRRSSQVVFAPTPESRFSSPGKGRNISGMGRDLYEIEPVFRDAFDQCALLLGEHLDRPLQEIVGYDTKVPRLRVFWTRPATRSRHFSLSNTRWHRCGVRGASSPRQSWDTAWANTWALALPARSVWKTHCAW